MINHPWDNPPAAAPVIDDQPATPPPPPPGVRITTGPTPFDATITAGGIDISRAVTAADIRLRAGWLPEVELTLDLVEVSTYAEPDRVLLPEPTRDALIALGWTPPAGTDGGQF